MRAPISTHVLAEPRSSLAYNLAGIAVLVFLLAVGVAYLIDRASQADSRALPMLNDINTVRQTLSGRDLDIPLLWFRYGEQVKEGFASQIDLRLYLTLDSGASPTPVGATLLPRSRARASSALLDAVYLHQFEDGSVGGVPGLVGKQLTAREGYAGETVWYDPLSPSPFVAKCANPVEPGRPAQCLRTIHLQSGLAAVLSFDATALQHWRQFDIELAAWLGRIGAL
ncbi:hypothetical protein [Devosia chinhatensis]|uniref:Uncharacterized protein n=1 Tax=Devosia chinhatensis TaxID=429727 RepID=A0A0F5FNQ4_9HYPH|nr:hypothetical protein [Devosia chinhatensis]KKB09822.1 hypothetical protein VE26_08230 [Devosia chinhatensis]